MPTLDKALFTETRALQAVRVPAARCKCVWGCWIYWVWGVVLCCVVLCCVVLCCQMSKWSRNLGAAFIHPYITPLKTNKTLHTAR